MEGVFWLSIGLIVYGYLGYPLMLLLWGKVRPRPVKNGDFTPRISFIIAACNEESAIAAKLENTLRLDYPYELREVIVLSDGSTDRTVEVAESFQSRGVRVIPLSERVGKSVALNEGIKAAAGDILVFTDVGAIAESDCLKNMVSNFADHKVGCVSSEDIIIGDANGAGEGAYVRYEMLLRKLESRIGSCAAVSGSLCAVRRELCPVFPPSAATDLLCALRSVKMGYRTVSDPSALARMGTVRSHGDEFGRKVRTVLTGLSCLPEMPALLNPLRYGLFSFELFSHKILRWCGGFLLVLLLFSNLLLASRWGVYVGILAGQVAAYGLAGLGSIFPGLARRSIIVRLPLFFLITNLAALVAGWRYLTGQRVAVWQPSKRAPVEEVRSS